MELTSGWLLWLLERLALDLLDDLDFLAMMVV